MNKTLAFVKLDLMTIKPQLRLLIPIFFLINGLYGYAFRSSPESMIVINGIYLTAVPMLISSSASLDVLYSTCPVNRPGIVWGRYIYLLCLYWMIAACSVAMSVILSVIFRYGIIIDWLSVFGTATICFFAFAIIVSIQFTINFALGNDASKILIIAPLLLSGLAGTMVSTMKDIRLPSDIDSLIGLMVTNPVITSLFLFILGIGVMSVSASLSAYFYMKREL